MLNKQTISTVKSTSPVLQEEAVNLTKHFYKRMFSNNPEVEPLFNKANQEAGRQQQALAGAICAYAANIDNLDALSGAVELIAHKHASLRIQPEHYPIVGENLLASISEVLGDGATDEIINAWGEAYNVLADILITREQQLYQDQVSTEGGWEDFKPFKVVSKIEECNLITSFYLTPEDNSKPPTFKPGQYITVRVPSPCGHTTMRNYSLSDKPNQNHFRISVKKELSANNNSPNGYVSNFLHNAIGIGDNIELAPPCGEFFLDVKEERERPLVLLAAGIGITPILSMLLTSLELYPDRKTILIHATLDENHQAFREEINKLDQEYNNLHIHYRYSFEPPTGIVRPNNHVISTGYVDAKLIEERVGQRDADYYFCGPKPFMVNIYRDLVRWKIPSDQIHFEFFGPREELESL